MRAEQTCCLLPAAHMGLLNKVNSPVSSPNHGAQQSRLPRFPLEDCFKVLANVACRSRTCFCVQNLKKQERIKSCTTGRAAQKRRSRTNFFTFLSPLPEVGKEMALSPENLFW